MVAGFQIPLYHHYQEDEPPLYSLAVMRDFVEVNAPGVFDLILQSILRDDDRLSADPRSLQEQGTVVLLHILAYFRLVLDSALNKFST